MEEAAPVGDVGGAAVQGQDAASLGRQHKGCAREEGERVLAGQVLPRKPANVVARPQPSQAGRAPAHSMYVYIAV